MGPDYKESTELTSKPNMAKIIKSDVNRSVYCFHLLNDFVLCDSMIGLNVRMEYQEAMAYYYMV